MKNFDDLMAVMTRLRAPGGCPWDAEQTYESLAPHLLEESYEAFDAIFEAATGSPAHLQEELGDVLLQVVFHSVIAKDKGDFTIEEVVDGITNKLILRHPHVFGDLKLEKADDVLDNWESFKKAERAALGREEKPRDSILDEVPLKFSGLLEAQKLTKKAAKVGFDWENIEQVFDKLHEEIDELKAAINSKSEESAEEIQAEIGDLFFVAVNLARKLKVDSETALKLSNRKFRRRFAFIEAQLKAQEKSLETATLAEMDALWNEAKKVKS